VGAQTGWATLGFEGREVGICGHARVGYSGEKKGNQATGAQILRTHCVGWCICAVGAQMGWATPGFEGREAGICGRARVGHLGEKKRKRSRWGSIFANASWGVVYLGSGSTDGVGYTRV
jgi:hypothetical protein